MKNEKQKDTYVCNSIEDLRIAFDEIKSVVAGDTRFMAQALLFIAEQANQVRVKPKRPRSAWQQFLSDELKQGKTMQQVASDWRRKSLKVVG
jgi:hypothetical protein